MRLVPLAVFLAGCGSTPPPTFYKDVVPLTQKHCNGCHVAGGIAPFSLDTYGSAKAVATQMASSVSAKRMPPWMASESCGGPFVEQNTLTPAQISILESWAKAGAPEGKASDAPVDAGLSGIQLAKVDATLRMAQPYSPDESLRDDYRCFVIDPALPASTTVTGYDILPGSRRVVHHVILYIVDRAEALAEDAKDTRAGWQCFGAAGIENTGALGAWAPGAASVVYPRGTGIRLESSKVLAMQVHYNADNGREPDQTTLRLMYGTGRETPATLLPVAADEFAIPAQAASYTYSQLFENSAGASLKVYGLMPHMHTKGKRITMELLNGGVDAGCIVDIPKWDFNWQSQYFRVRPLEIGATSSVKMTCTWENPTSNVIRWGEGTNDEMCFAFVYATL